jgi:hypothetical protein
LRDWYVTVCGGWSPDLRLDQIGINRQALEANTSLDPAVDRVRVTILGHVRRPILMDRLFEVVPLDEAHPGALRHSPAGEAVFPEGDEVLRPAAAPQPGEPVLLNNVVRRLAMLPSSEEFARILQDAFRRVTGSEGTNS